jgi:uncharacterized surface protein with fasciclin (FAS1) repeats
MHAIRNFALLLGIAAAGLAMAAGKPVAKKNGNAHPERRTIAAVVAASPDFRTLGTVLASAGLTEGLGDSGPHTLFAPTNAAFARLPAGTLAELMKPENHDKLLAIMDYHLVPLVVDAKELSRLKAVPTVDGDPLTVTLDGKQVLVDNAHVAKTEIQATNGVIFTIDTLLMPDGR